MGISRTVLSISCCLSVAIAAGLLILLSRVGAVPSLAEAAESQAAPLEGGPPGGPGPASLRANVENLVTASGQINQRAIQALKAQGARAVPELLRRFTAEDKPLQDAILTVLRARDEPEVFEALLASLDRGPSVGMGLKIGTALDARGFASHCERLAALTRSPAPGARAGAARALRGCTDRASSLALLRLVKTDEEDAVRAHALASLRGGPITSIEQAIAAALSDASALVRIEAVRIVEEKRIAAFSDDVEWLSREDPSPRVRRLARRALGAFTSIHAEPEEPGASEEESRSAEGEVDPDPLPAPATGAAAADSHGGRPARGRPGAGPDDGAGEDRELSF